MEELKRVVGNMADLSCSCDDVRGFIGFLISLLTDGATFQVQLTDV